MTKQADVLNDPMARSLLDHGFVRIVDYMGNDAAIVQAARVSYGAGTKSVNADRTLLRYLMRQQHCSPFEMCAVKFHVRAPIFVVRQWARHRASSTNEESARYSEMTDEFYMPDPAVIKPQSSDNKQGRFGSLNEKDIKGTQWLLDASYAHSHDIYRALIGDRTPRKDETTPIYDAYAVDGLHGVGPLYSDEFPGIARELARTVMPVGAYTEFYWQSNLRNLFNFLNLRSDPHAQYEIRVYAEAMIDLIRPLFPQALEAFDDYVKGAVTLSRMEMELTKTLLSESGVAKDVLQTMIETHGGDKSFALAMGMSLRELNDYRERFSLT